LAKLHLQTKIQKSNLLRHGHSQPRQETADRRLYRKTKPSPDLDESPIGGQNPHLPRPGIPPKHAVKQTHQKGSDAVFALDELGGLLFPGNRQQKKVFVAIFIEWKYAKSQFFPYPPPLG